MHNKEAKARIKINKLLEEAGWRFFDDEKGKANILLENTVKISQKDLDSLGENFEKTKTGFIDFLLLDSRGFPLIVLEAKKEGIEPLSAKEQARKYAIGQKVRFIILSNGNKHYFWDIEKGDPEQIITFPSQESLEHSGTIKPDRDKLINEVIGKDYIVQSQNPNYIHAPQYNNPETGTAYIADNKLKFLREYQIKAVQSIQTWVKEGRSRFLFEMATGTGKTLVSGAVIKLFLRTGNIKRVLFLVDRLELERQAHKNLNIFLKNDCQTVIFKESRDDWRKAEIVVTTVQSLLFNNKYRNIFSPTDFDLVISDEAHRSIGGNARAVFEYFTGYKLGLTATPKDYLKKSLKITGFDPRELERRQLLDTYRTFGCENREPTFQYSLLHGVKDGFLVNPKVIDARTEITTKLLSDEGYVVLMPSETEVEKEDEVIFMHRDFERKFFSDETNLEFCKTFMDNAHKDPITHEIGKSIIFCVSQNHAARITQVLNKMATSLFPGKYNSDFALQVTSLVQDAQRFSTNFANNNLNGETQWLEDYKSSKTRVCVTVGMMTTGYDCEDLLNIVLMRPIFSPTDFIQIKGRGTRKFTFKFGFRNEMNEKEEAIYEKEKFILFDFFANYEYFEEKYDYDQVLKLPVKRTSIDPSPPDPPREVTGYENLDKDPLATKKEYDIGIAGMKIDRMFFQGWSDEVSQDDFVKEKADQGEIDENVISYVMDKYIGQTDSKYTLDKLRKSLKIDRKISVRELLEHIFYGHKLKMKNEMLEEEFEKFVSIYKPENIDILATKYYFKAYITDPLVRKIVDTKEFAELYNNPTFSADDYLKVDDKMKEIVPDYIKTYVAIEKFAA